MDKEKALSYYVKKKRKKRATIISSVCAILLTAFIIIALSIFSTDRFTISTVEENELYLTLDKETSTTKLVAPPLLKALDTQYTEVIESLDEGVGSKNTDYYFAYSFYLGGYGDSENINYNLAMSLNDYSNNLEEAIRIMIIINGIKEVYAKSDSNDNVKPIYDGEKHESDPIKIGETKSFRKNKNIIVESYYIKPGEFDKYTIVIWIDGWESVNEMKGGVFSADVKFSTHFVN